MGDGAYFVHSDGTGRNFGNARIKYDKSIGKPKWFENYGQFVRDYRRNKGLQDDVCLHQNRKEQSRLDDWKEFQFREYRKADGFIREIEHAEEELKF